MTIQQLSIFIENRSGTLVNVLQVLKNAHVQIVASTIADTAEYGIYRVICTEPQRAFDALKEAGVAVALSEVFALELFNEPGCAAEAVRTISDAGISIVYLYSFLFYGKGILIFRTDDVDEARQIIKANGMKYLTEGDLAD
jgi:hypothetical protein